MSNRVCIEPTMFLDVYSLDPSSNPPFQKSYGVRVYDDYAKTYTNIWDVIPADGLDVLSKCLAEMMDDEVFRGIIENVIENEKGIHIGSVYYSFEQIKPCLVKAGFRIYNEGARIYDEC